MNNLNNGQKVGVLTFHRAENYGSVLQAYALQKYLTDKLGIENGLIIFQVDRRSFINYLFQ